MSHTNTPAGIDLDKLEALARAAAQHGDDIGEDEWYSTDENMSLFVGNPDLALVAACSPVAVLALIALARAGQQAGEAACDAWTAGQREAHEQAIKVTHALIRERYDLRAQLASAQKDAERLEAIRAAITKEALHFQKMDAKLFNAVVDNVLVARAQLINTTGE